MPGVQRYDLSTRRTKPEVMSKCVKFSPSGDSFCVATTEGLIIYSIDSMMIFNPVDLDSIFVIYLVNITPDTIEETIKEGNMSKALIMSLCLNENKYIVKSIEKCNFGEIPLVVKSIPIEYINRLLEIICTELETTQHLEYYLNWCLNILQCHGEIIRKNTKLYLSSLRSLHKIINLHHNDLVKLTENNVV